MNEHEKSDSLIVLTSPPNKATQVAAEAGEGRGLAKGNTDSTTRPGHSAGEGVSSGLDRVREVARRDKDVRFTALLHHVDLSRLWPAYTAINPKAAPGVDKVTWEDYGQDLRATSKPARTGPQRRIPGETDSQGVHTETRRAAETARHRRLGGQDPPAGGGRGVERHVRGRLPRVLLRVPARAQPASCARCAGDRHPAEEGELGARRRHQRLLLQARSCLVGEVSQAPHCGQEGPAPHPKWLDAGVIEDGKWSETKRGHRRGHRCHRCSPTCTSTTSLTGGPGSGDPARPWRHGRHPVR